MENYKLSVIMSNYNQACFIDQAVKSVLSQKTNFPFQLIITDDNSTKDNSITKINKYIQEYPDKIKVIFNEENGRYLKNILGALKITKTPYFTLLDADDYWTDENHLQKAVDYLDTHPDFTIYSSNVTCISEGDSPPYPIIKTNIKEADFSLDDYFQNNILTGQTTGMVFRNIIFSNGIPKFLENAIGSISERSFEGDSFRFVMHLKYGKSHFVNNSCGVYRILSSGIWCSLSNFERNLFEAQAQLNYNEYFDYKYHVFFMQNSLCYLKQCIDYLNNISDDKDKEISINSLKIFLCTIKMYLENNQSAIRKEPKKLKFRLLMKIYKHCRKRLSKEGFIS